MKAQFSSIEKLSTGRHFLAFRADPPSSCLLSSTSVLVLQLVAQSPDEDTARGRFIALCGEKFSNPQKTYDQQSSALREMGLIEK